jgi:hypothetical protein
MQLYSVAAAAFRKLLLKGMDMRMIDALMAATDDDAVAEILFPYFAEFVLHTYPEEIASYRRASLQLLPTSAARPLCKSPCHPGISHSNSAVIDQQPVVVTC